LNLLGNAVKFTSDGHISVRATYESGCLVLQVSDTGIGMSDETISRLFTPFMQADGSTTRRFGGTGLGLAITDRLVSVMDGQIEVSSEEGTGTTFTVSLPMPPAEPSLVEPSPAESVPSILPAGLHVLLAEDDAINLFVARCMLQRLGCRVSVAADGQQATDMALSGTFDAIFMDVHMPIVDGLEATRRIRQQEDPAHHHNIIIGLSADAMRMEQQDGIASGMDVYLTKPIDKSVLHGVLVTVSRCRHHTNHLDIPSQTSPAALSAEAAGAGWPETSAAAPEAAAERRCSRY
jgi:CheY-like chemotaxis protein